MTTAQVTIEGSGATAKVREPLGVALLDLVTLGVYGFVWYYRVHTELAELGRARGTSELGDDPRLSLLAVLPGFILIVPMLVSFWNAVRRVEAAERLAGVPDADRMNPMLGFVLLIPFPAGAAYLQAHLNRVWAAQGNAGQGSASAETRDLVAAR